MRLSPVFVFAVTLAGCVDNPADPIRLPAVIATATPPQRLVSTTGVEMIDFGPFGPGEAFQPGNLNNRNEIVGNITDRAIFGSRPAVWRDGIVTELDALGSVLTSTAAINEVGDVTGSVLVEHGPGVTRFRGVVWSNGAATLLPQVSPGSSDQATDINDQGNVVGSSFVVGSFRPQMVVWSAGTPSVLPMPSGIQFAAPNAINNQDWVIGKGARTVSFASAGVLWRASEAIDLGIEQAFGLNDAGVIVGSTGSRPLKWSNGSTTFLDTPGPGDAWGINSSGEIVGQVDVGGVATAVHWSQDGTLKELGSLPGLSSCTARRINDNGWVLGNCSSGAPTYATHFVLWKVRPPTPTELFDQLEAEVAAISGVNTKSLMALLDAAEKHYARDRGAVAALLDAFMTQVDNMRARGDLTSATAESLLKKARQILDQL